jgi:hypothetical protein
MTLEPAKTGEPSSDPVPSILKIFSAVKFLLNIF